MVRFKIAPKIIECADGEMEWKQEEDTPPPSPSPEPEPIPEAVLKRERRKKKLSEAQLAALEKGRMKVQENKRKKDLKKKRDELVKRKEEKEFIDNGIKQNKSAKALKTEIKKSTKETKIREKLLEKKKKKEWETQRQARWELMREDALDRCETIEDFDELSEHLNTVETDDIFDDEKLKSKLNKIYDMYKYVPKEPVEAEDGI
tara:strand:- start:886 stop:1497 length:612 start_codon:yes stop_codon:yes gene_type:complete